MSSSGLTEHARRFVVMALLVAGGSLIGTPLAAAVALCAALAVYLLPAVRLPPGARTFSRMTAVIMPDVVGFLLTGFLILLPIWMAREDPGRWGLAHPAVWLTGPVAAISALILVHSANKAAYHLLIDATGMTVVSAWSTRRVEFSDVIGVEPYRRGLPRWMVGLQPLLVSLGAFTAAGSLRLARDTTGIRVHVAGQRPILIEREGFERPFADIRKVLANQASPKTPRNRSGGVP